MTGERMAQITRKYPGKKADEIYRKVDDGTFPKPVKLGANRGGRIAWRASALTEWLSKLPKAA